MILTSLLSTRCDTVYAQLFNSREKRIKLDSYFKDRTKADQEIEDFERCFRWAPNETLFQGLVCQVKMEHINKLHKIADDRANPGEDYITGLRVILGAEPSGNLILFFQPVYIGVNNSLGSTIRGNVIESNDNFFWECDGVGGLRQVGDVRLVYGSQLLYQQSIELDRMGDKKFKKFRKGTKKKHDTESMIFSFQEIYCLYFMRYGNLTIPDDPFNAPANIFSKPLAFWNASNFKGKNGKKANRHKHSLLISGKLKDKGMAFASIDPDDDANLAHLCPPSTNCGTLEFPEG